MSRKSKEDNPFSFSNFSKDDPGDSLPFPDKPPKKKKKKKRDSVPSTQVSPEPETLIGQRKSGKEENPFAFNAFVAKKPSSGAAGPAISASPEATISPPPTAKGPPAPPGVQHKRSSSAGLPPLPSENASSASSLSDTDSDNSDIDSDSDDDGGGGLPPAPAITKPGSDSTQKLTKGKPGGDDAGGGGSILARLKRRMALLTQQLEAAKGELEMTKEQNELDTFELREENAKLKKQLKSAKEKATKAEKSAASSAAALARRKDNERMEAEVLEDFTARIQQNLERSNARAAAAEAQVASLSAELNRLKGNDLSGGAIGQVRAASRHLDTLAKESEANLRKLCEGVKTFQLVSQLLQSVDRVTEED